MAKVRSATKERYWRKLIKRQQNSGEGPTVFCRRMGVSTHQFFWWRRTLRERDATPRSRNGDDRGGRLPEHGSGDVPESAFIPIRLPVARDSSMEVVHPQGCVIRVSSLFDTHMLRRVLAALDAPALTLEEY